jgi:hypothetical protein
VISAAENSNKFPKTRFWRENPVEDVVTLGPTAQATLVSCLCTGFFHENRHFFEVFGNLGFRVLI